VTFASSLVWAESPSGLLPEFPGVSIHFGDFSFGQTSADLYSELSPNNPVSTALHEKLLMAAFFAVEGIQSIGVFGLLAFRPFRPEQTTSLVYLLLDPSSGGSSKPYQY